MLPLAAPVDVAGTLGLTESQLSAGQKLRIPLIVAKLSSLFRREAGCQFTPGVTTVRLLSVAGRITLPDKLDDIDDDTGLVTDTGVVSKVQKYRDGKDVDFTVVAQDVIPQIATLLGRERAGTGDSFVVTYNHRARVPDEVVSTIAMSTARYLTVDPKSAVAQSTFLSSEGYHQRMAQWVADTVKLSATDIQTARDYRSTPACAIVAKSGGRESQALFEDSWLTGEAAW